MSVLLAEEFQLYSVSPKYNYYKKYYLNNCKD